jgi:hypothetical protein
MPFQCARGPFSHNEEPTLEQMLSDDIVQLVMARDRMTAEAMRQLASEVRDRAFLECGNRPIGEGFAGYGFIDRDIDNAHARKARLRSRCA